MKIGFKGVKSKGRQVLRVKGIQQIPIQGLNTKS